MRKINGDRVLSFYDKLILCLMFIILSIFLTFGKVVAILSYIFIN